MYLRGLHLTEKLVALAWPSSSHPSPLPPPLPPLLIVGRPLPRTEAT